MTSTHDKREELAHLRERVCFEFDFHPRINGAHRSQSTLQVVDLSLGQQVIVFHQNHVVRGESDDFLRRRRDRRFFEKRSPGVVLRVSRMRAFAEPTASTN